jgi:hypothetical protein
VAIYQNRMKQRFSAASICMRQHDPKPLDCLAVDQRDNVASGSIAVVGGCLLASDKLRSKLSLSMQLDAELFLSSGWLLLAQGR